ncbi:hypothetical protein NDI52_32415 [Leptolyngbya sp. PL-A3]
MTPTNRAPSARFFVHGTNEKARVTVGSAGGNQDYWDCVMRQAIDW